MEHLNNAVLTLIW